MQRAVVGRDVDQSSILGEGRADRNGIVRERNAAAQRSSVEIENQNAAEVGGDHVGLAAVWVDKKADGIKCADSEIKVLRRERHMSGRIRSLLDELRARRGRSWRIAETGHDCIGRNQVDAGIVESDE